MTSVLPRRRNMINISLPSAGSGKEDKAEALAAVEADGVDDFATGIMWTASSRKGDVYPSSP